MTEQEKQLISGLAERVQNAPAQQIDRDAEELIHRTMARPDAMYILTQTVLVQEMALNQAKAQIEDLKQRLNAQPSLAPQSGGFLPSAAPTDWSRVQQAAPAGYQQAPYPQPQYQQPPYAPQGGGGFGGFLRNAASTVAGVVAGEIAFDSLASLFGGHHGGFFGGGGGLFGGGVSPGSETIVNNYYGNEQPGGAGGDSQFADAANQSGQDVSSDIDDERNASGSNFLGGDDSGNDTSDAFDDSSYGGDSGGSDDGGGS